MISRSILAVVVAVLLSLLVHGLGLSFTAREKQQSDEGGASDLADVGGAFEDFSKVTTETPAPEPAQVPDPPSVTPPDPVDEEIPTSQALVASDNPQNVTSPDTGETEVTEPNPAEPSESEASASGTAEQSGGDDETISDVAALQPVEADTIAESPEGTPDGDPDPSAAQANEAAPTPELPEITVASAPDEIEILTAEESEDVSKSAVTKSLRPPKNRPSVEALGAIDGVQQQSGLQGGVIESPLTAYRRTGVDPFGSSGSGGQSGSTGFSGARNTGNSSITNYAGQVLIKLNRSPILYASAHGAAQVAFEINPDGTLAWVRILRSTGSPDINRAASAQVRSTAPFPPPPGGTSKRMSFIYRNR